MRTSMRSARAASRWLTLCLFACACLPGERVATQLLVSVYADADVARELKLVRAFLYRVDEGDENAPTEELPFPVLVEEREAGSVPMLFSFGITQGQEERFKLVIKGYDTSDTGAEAVIEQKAIASFQPHQKLAVDMLLGSACYDRAADCSGLTRTCVPIGSEDRSAGDCAPVPAAIARPELRLPTADVDGVGERVEPVDDTEAAALDAGATGEDAAARGPDASAERPAEAAVAEPAPAWPPAGCDDIYPLRAHAEGDATAPLTVPPGSVGSQVVELDAPWGDEQVQAIGFRALPDTRSVLRDFSLQESGSGAQLMVWTPGDEHFVPYPSDVGVAMPAGPRSMRLSVTYDTSRSTASVQDRSGVEVCIVRGAKLRANRAAITMSLVVFGPVLAPADTRGHAATRTCTVSATSPVHLIASVPYARRYAVATRFTVGKRDGSTETLVDAAYTWGSQRATMHVPAVLLETGDTVTTTCIYDNTSAVNATFGENPNTNEMCFNFATYWPAGALTCN